jgi:hypothetical protein
MNKNKIVDRYFLEIDQLGDGRLKVCMAKKLIGLNQHKRTWKPLNSRNLARKINKSSLVIK